ncbi:histidine phosphatase family protein [Actinoplanes sp. NPDC049681]|uniref:histidine phosphatase family protein n=1 Tax=Actinoplanes sp. NPDC049681 TaxID=3363905 RepID=UPI00379C37BB
MTARYVYLARHGDAVEGAGLTDAGREQAELLAGRLAGVPLASVTHSPLQRAVETAAVLGHPGVPSEVVGDYVPYAPDPLPPTLQGWTAEELAEGPRLAAEALARFARPADTETHELIVTHAFLVAWFVRDALGAPPERWLGLHAANCALTVIRYTHERPPALVLFNDMVHLPPELRWTGFPPHLRPA